jgi:hypothetical protein
MNELVSSALFFFCLFLDYQLYMKSHHVLLFGLGVGGGMSSDEDGVFSVCFLKRRSTISISPHSVKLPVVFFSKDGEFNTQIFSQQGFSALIVSSFVEE